MADIKIPKSEFPVHLVGNAHLDPVWLWPWTEGMSEIKSTLRAALDRLAEYPDFVFTCAGASYYEWIEEFSPEMFEEIRKYVKEGRWVIVNGWYVQPDCNLPCGESFARQSLYSQRYFKEKFGVISKVGYNVDSFGHNGMLPQILKKSGMDSYVFCRPGPHENNRVPSHFAWESADGSRVMGSRQRTYGMRDMDGLKYELRDAVNDAAKFGHPEMAFYGICNHGGGPTIAMIDFIKSVQEQNPNLIFSSPEHYAEAMKDVELPVWNEDLQIHAIGCYSAMLEVKQANRKAETALLSAENLDVASHMLLNTKLHTDGLKDGWKRVMFNQFHDLICGCSIPKVYEDSKASYGYAMQKAGDVANLATQKVAWAIDTLGDAQLPRSKDEDWILWGFADRGSPVVLFNPLPFPVKQQISVFGEFSSITDSEGNLVPLQRVRNPVCLSLLMWNTLFTAEIPAMGYATYWLHKGKPEEVENADLISGEYVLENPFIRVEIDPESGKICQITDKATGKGRLKGPISALVIDETESDTWGHDLFSYRDVIGSFEFQKMEWLERGPLRATVRLEYVYGNSTLRMDVSLGSESKSFDLRMKIHWHEKHKMLKLEVPVATFKKSITAEIPYGVISRPADGTEKPIQRWVDMSSATRGGLAIVNDSTHAVDALDGVIRLTVLRSPIYGDHFLGKDRCRDYASEYTEQGERDVTFRFIPHAGDWREAEPVKEAYILNTPIHPVYETYHKGTLPQKSAGLILDKNNIFAAALKESEDGSAYILRCHEAHGADTENVSISLPYIDRTWTANFGHYEIKTFRIPKDASLPVEETNLIEF